jgi:phage gp45-like
MTALRNLTTRVGMLFGIGRITTTSTGRGKGRGTLTAQVQFPNTGEVRDDTPILSVYGLTSRPRPGADAAVLFLGGNRGAGVVIATDDGRFTITLAEGEVALHTHDGSHVHLKLRGEIAIKAATKVTMDTPLFEVTGDAVIGGKPFLAHDHDEHGTGGGVTGPPR